MWDGYLSSDYHSLQVALNKQFSRGLMIKGAYTYSKAIDMTDDDGWTGVGWNYGPVFNRNRAPAGFDRRHVFQVGWLYELPFGKGKQWAQTGPAAILLGLAWLGAQCAGKQPDGGSDQDGCRAHRRRRSRQILL